MTDNDMTFKYTEEKPLEANEFERVGYIFLGWSTSKNATTATYTDKEVVSKLTAENNGTVTLYAVWEAKTFKVTFDVNGGKELTLTPELEALGYYINNGKVTVDVTYDKAYPTLPTPEYKDETMYFAGWMLDGGEVGSTVKLTDDATLVAEWTDEYVHNVIFNKYNEDGTSYSTTVINKTAIVEPAEPTKTGYTFDFWSLDEENGTAYDFSTIIKATSVQTINLYPYWVANTYTVKYDGNGATEGAMSDSTHTYDTEKTLDANAYKKTGYTFMGWDTDPAGETVVYKDAEAVLNLTETADGVVTLYAVWEEKEYKVIYDGNGADGTMSPSMHYYDIEKALNINTFEKEGYEFLGWAFDKDATVADFEDGEIVKNLTAEEEITIYAIWKAKTIKLTFNVNGGEALDISELGADYYVDAETGKITVDVTYNGQYPVLPVAKYPENAMSFGGWALDGNIIADGDTVTITEDAELVAVWTDKHIVVFHGYYKNNTDSLIVYVEDGQAVARPADPAHSSFTFGGWYTDEACTDGNEYDFATIINKVNDEYQTIHIYPRWFINVRFFYGPEAIESELKAEISVQYNTVIPETAVPESRKAYGYWKDGTVSDAYVGEEYEHIIEFKWYKEAGDSFELFDLTQPITGSIDLFNVARTVDVYVSSSSFNAIDGAAVGAIYTDDEPLYENILDVIFANENLINSVYEKIGQKEKVFNKLISLGIIDENMNILNQAKFLRFSLMGEERLEKFIYENVEKELSVDAKESISSYINHLIEKNDGSAEAFIRELIDALLNGDGKNEMKSVLKDMLTEMVDLEKDEFVKYINDYIDEAIDSGDTASVEELIAPQIEKLLTEQIAKDFVREMSKEQLGKFMGIYVDSLTDAQIKEEVKTYINGLSETEIEEEVVEYVNGLSDDEVKAEIKAYIEGLTGEALKEELLSYVKDMNNSELSEAIVDYINNISEAELKSEIKNYITGLALSEQKQKIKEYFEDLEPDEVKAEIKKYIDDLDNDGKKAEIKNYINGLSEADKEAEVKDYIFNLTGAELSTEITSYVTNMDDVEFKSEITAYIAGLNDPDFAEELKKYLDENDEEYENLIKEYLGLADDVVITDEDKADLLDDVIDYVVTTPGKKDETIGKAADYITTSKKADYQVEIVDKVTTNFGDYIDKITEKAVNSDIDSYIDKASEKILSGQNLENYIDNVVNKITSNANETNSYIDKTVDYIVADETRLDTYIGKAINVIVSDEGKKQQYIIDTADFIVSGANRATYVEKAVNTILGNEELKAKYTAEAVDKIATGEDADEYISKAVGKILSGEKRSEYIDKTINAIFDNGKQQIYIDKAISKIVNKTPEDYSDIDGYIDEMFESSQKKAKIVDYINEQFIENADFRTAILPDAIDMIFADADAKADVVETIVDYVMNNEQAFNDAINIAIEDLVTDAEFREHTIDRIAHYLEDHPEIMEKVLEFAKESELGVFVDKFIEELKTKDKFEVSEDNLFVAESIERAVGKYDYDSFMNEYVPGRFAGLVPDSVLKPIYEDALGGFKAQLVEAIEIAKNGGVAYVDSGVTVRINPIADFVVPVFNKYLEFKGKAEDKMDEIDGILGGIYDNVYGENKYLKELVNILSIENFLNGDKSLATETLSGYSLREFADYYEIYRNAKVLRIDANKWYLDKIPDEKAKEVEARLAQKIAEYYNSILALVNDYGESGVLPSYKDVLEIFEGDIPDRFFSKYESALSKVEAKIDIDDKAETVYNKLAQKGIISKFDTIIDKFVASKFNREITEEQIPLIYSMIRKGHGYDDFYTVDTVFDVMSKLLGRFKVTEDLYRIGNSKLKITIERSYR